MSRCFFLDNLPIELAVEYFSFKSTPETHYFSTEFRTSGRLFSTLPQASTVHGLFEKSSVRLKRPKISIESYDANNLLDRLNSC